MHSKKDARSGANQIWQQDVRVSPLELPGILSIPDEARGMIVFAHGSGSSRLSPRNTFVASALNSSGLATLLFDLLVPSEEADRRNVFDIPLLADRLLSAAKWLKHQPAVAEIPIGLFGASTGAAAALVAAAEIGNQISAVVSRGGRPDLAGPALERVIAPTLLIVGGHDFGVIEFNEQALAQLRGPKALRIIPGATHLFQEPGALEAVVEHATAWFKLHLCAPRREDRTIGPPQMEGAMPCLS